MPRMRSSWQIMIHCGKHRYVINLGDSCFAVCAAPAMPGAGSPAVVPASSCSVSSDLPFTLGIGTAGCHCGMSPSSSSHSDLV